jgi:hypothetical protein
MVVHEEEVPLGYPKHIRRVIGHLGEASRECLAEHRDFAALLREWRLVVMLKRAVPPYDDLLDYVDIILLLDEDTDFPEIPGELHPGK